MTRLIEPGLKKLARVLALSLALCSAACTSTPLRYPVDGDPFERVNRSVYAFNSKLDHAVLRPMARGTSSLPVPLSRALHNFIDNLMYPVTAVNDFLQGNLHHGTNDLARLLLNTTVGIGGLLDPATAAGLDRNCQDFGITLGKWGVPRGPYLVLPLLGPSTVRDAAATTPGLFVYVLVPGPAIGLGILGGDAIEERARLLPADMLVESAYDPYAFQRNIYMQHRDFQVRESNEQLTKATHPTRAPPAARVQPTSVHSLRRSPAGRCARRVPCCALAHRTELPWNCSRPSIPAAPFARSAPHPSIGLSYASSSKRPFKHRAR